METKPVMIQLSSAEIMALTADAANGDLGLPHVFKTPAGHCYADAREMHLWRLARETGEKQ